MINLLPPKKLLDMRIARNNTILRRYLHLAAISFVVIAASLAAAYYFLNTQYQNAKKVTDITQQKVVKLEPVQKKAEQLSATINTIAGLFSQNIKFSETLVSIGSVMPDGSVLTGLQFSVQDLDSPLVVSAQVESEERAAVLRNNLASSPLFKSAEIKSIVEIKEDESVEAPTSSDQPAQAPPQNSYKYTTIISAHFKDKSGAR